MAKTTFEIIGEFWLDMIQESIKSSKDEEAEKDGKEND